uniref:G-patch domain-containing protein n=1 Tax=Ciona intestinalis TaxID=7719 RepID=H2XPF6_CIOIN
MGWGGSGGLGKSGEGRTDPVILTSSFNRRGFGTNQNEPTIISSKDATRVLKEFLAKNCDGELTFSSELDGNERKVIMKQFADLDFQVNLMVKGNRDT